jgi:cell division protein FtsN
MKNISIILLVILAFTFVSCKGKKEKETADNKDTIVYPSYEDFKPNETDLVLLDSTEVDSTVTEVVYTEDKQGNLTPQTDESKGTKYYVIVGSFKVYNNAIKLQNHFQSMGYTVEILPKTNEYNRVSVSSYNDKSSAVVELKSLRSKHNDASFWIFYK